MQRQLPTKETAATTRKASAQAARAPHLDTPAQKLLQLQRTYGNRAVGRMLQAKLRVSQPDDQYEQEADRVAEQVMRMPTPVAVVPPAPVAAKPAAPAPKERPAGLQRTTDEEEEEDRPEEAARLSRKVADGGRVQRVTATAGVPLVQRVCASCRKELAPIQRVCSSCRDELQRQASDEREEEEEGEELLQRAGGTGAAGGGDEAPSGVTGYLAGIGQSGRHLPGSVRGLFEPRFGYDFSQVRVHTDAGAAASARSVGALAYTVGRDVVFGAGQYAPETSGGQRLLAHELTHVVQQGYAQPFAPPAPEQPTPAAEADAPAAAQTAQAVEPAAEQAAASPALSPAPVARAAMTAAVQRQVVVSDPTNHTMTEAEADALTLEALDAAIARVKAELEHTPIVAVIYETLARNLEILEAARKRKAPAEPLEADDLSWDDEEGEEGTAVEKYGVVNFDGYDRKGAKVGSVTDVALRQLPTTSSTALKRLPVNTRFLVDRELAGGWYSVVLDDGTDGYVAKQYVSTDMPDADARLHRIKPGETALDIVRRYYKGDAVEWGQDERFYVNVLVLVNEQAGRKWIFKPEGKTDWDDTKTLAGGQIWIPGLEFAKSLHGVVSSGSITYEAWATIRDLAIGIVAFLAGLLHGVFSSIKDLFVGLYDLVKLVFEFLWSLVTGNIVSDIKKLWNDVSSLSYKDIKAAIAGWWEDNWNNPSVWTRWHFRGWLIGYAIAEIAMFFLTGGAATVAKWAGRGAKIVKLIAELPVIAKLVRAAKFASGKTVEAVRAAIKGVEALSAAHAWAKRVLRIPYKILVNVSEEAAERLRRLPEWARERFADLNYGVKRWLLGCASPCKVDVLAIEKYLKELTPAAKAGAKLLASEADIIKALPKEMKTSKILAKLKTRPALLKAITEAKLTDADFLKLADFLSDADKASPASAYKTFVRYLTNVVPAKTEGDLNKFNKIAAELIKADPRQGAALKGSMFEQFAKLNVPELGGKNFQKVKFASSKLSKARTADNFVAETGELWDIKHSLSKVPVDQADDYKKILGMKTAVGDEVKSINYLFPSEEAAKASAYLKNAYGFRVFFINPTTRKLVQLL